MIIKKYSILRTILLIAILTAIPIAKINAIVDDYLGIAAMCSYTKLKENYGGNIVAQHPMVGLHASYGHRFNDLLGLEFGFEIDKSRVRFAKIYQGDYFAGQIIQAPTQYQVFHTKIFAQQYPYVAISARKIVTEQNFVSLLIGISGARIRARFNLIADETGSQLTVNNFSKIRAITMVKLTAERQLNDQFGTRTFIGWRNTSKIKITSEEQPFSGPEIKLKDNINVGFGITYYL